MQLLRGVITTCLQLPKVAVWMRVMMALGTYD